MRFTLATTAVAAIIAAAGIANGELAVPRADSPKLEGIDFPVLGHSQAFRLATYFGPDIENGLVNRQTFRLAPKNTLTPYGNAKLLSSYPFFVNATELEYTQGKGFVVRSFENQTRSFGSYVRSNSNHSTAVEWFNPDNGLDTWYSARLSGLLHPIPHLQEAPGSRWLKCKRFAGFRKPYTRFDTQIIDDSKQEPDHGCQFLRVFPECISLDQVDATLRPTIEKAPFVRCWPLDTNYTRIAEFMDHLPSIPI